MILNNYQLAISPNQEREISPTNNEQREQQSRLPVAGMKLKIQVCVSTEIRKVLEHEHVDYINEL